MFGLPLSARNAKNRPFASGVAMAVALACGTVVAVTGVATPAYAKSKKKDDGKPDYGKAFVEAYQAANELVEGKQGAEMEPARAELPKVIASVTNDDERSAAGQLILNVGIGLQDKELQRQGIIMQLESGKLDPARIPQFSYFAGSLSWEADNFQDAVTYFNKAIEAGYTGDNIELLLLESYVGLGQPTAGLDRIAALVKQRGTGVSEDTIRRALQIVYEGGMKDRIADWCATLVRYYPNAQAWNTASNVILDSYELSSQEGLNLYRLMRRTDALLTARDYVEYISAADARRMANEVLPVANEGIAKGVLEPGDVFVEEALEVAGSRVDSDRAEAGALGDEARASDKPVTARAAADNFFAIGDYASAEEMYQLALDKGDTDIGRIKMRMAIAQTEQDKWDEAKANFEAVTDANAPVAKMWLAYVDVETGAVAQPAPAPAEAPAAE